MDTVVRHGCPHENSPVKLQKTQENITEDSKEQWYAWLIYNKYFYFFASNHCFRGLGTHLKNTGLVSVRTLGLEGNITGAGI